MRTQTPAEGRAPHLDFTSMSSFDGHNHPVRLGCPCENATYCDPSQALLRDQGAGGPAPAYLCRC